MRYVPTEDQVAYLQRIGVPAFQGSGPVAGRSPAPRKRKPRTKPVRPKIALPSLAPSPQRKRNALVDWLNLGLGNLVDRFTS